MLMKEEEKARQSGISSPWGDLSWYRRNCDEITKMEIEKSGKIKSVDPTIGTNAVEGLGTI